MNNDSLLNFKELVGAHGSFVYFLFDGPHLVYIGQSRSLLSRVGSHKKNKQFDKVRVIEVPRHLLHEVELAFIRTFRPKFNVQPMTKATDRDAQILSSYANIESIKNSEPPVVVDGEFCFDEIFDPAKFYGQVFFFNEEKQITMGWYDDDDVDDNDNDCAVVYSGNGPGYYLLKHEDLFCLKSLGEEENGG